MKYPSMRVLTFVLAVVGSCRVAGVASFSSTRSSQPTRRPFWRIQAVNDNPTESSDDRQVQAERPIRKPGGVSQSRKSFLQSSLVAAVGATGALLPSGQPSLALDPNKGETTVFKTPSGLKYIDLVEGTGPTPKYGQLLSFQYTSYIKLPDTTDNPNQKPQQYDSSNGFVTKHGNGRLIPGLDEGLHTLKVGGVRRLLIPPKLGYVDIGLGPIPQLPWQRWKLNKLLDQMIASQGGTVVMEIKLINIMDDEADQGYYNDASLSPEEFETLKNNIQRKAAEKNAAKQQEPSVTVPNNIV